jgi:nickel superoxide dismutase
MRLLTSLLRAADRVHPPLPVQAHCDLPCGVYDPAQARIEAQSVKAIMERYHQNQDPDYRTRCVAIKEERADLVKHHLWVLWTDYFKPEHLDKVANLHDLFWRATKAAGDAKKTMDVAVADKLLGLIDEVDAAFKATKS